jgi:hypothetical protein
MMVNGEIYVTLSDLRADRDLRKRYCSFLFVCIIFLMTMVTAPCEATEPGAVIVLGASDWMGTYEASEYGSGFIAKYSEKLNTAYVVTAKHVINGSDRIYVLYNPIDFPASYHHELAKGRIPVSITTEFANRGYPPPTEVRNGMSTSDMDTALSGSIYFRVESHVLSGGGEQYLAILRPDALRIYHLYPAAVLHKSNNELDVAVLSITDFTPPTISPVLYLATLDSIAIGSQLISSGCARGKRGLEVDLVSVPGIAIDCDNDFIKFESTQIDPGFSGGPVYKDDYVIAINLSEDLKTGAQIRSRLAATFKPLVDQWIGLPRMRIDLTIESPVGTRDGIVSIDQNFTIKANATLDPTGQLLAPTTRLALKLPDQFSTADPIVADIALGEEVRWQLRSSTEIHDPVSIQLNVADSASEEPGNNLTQIAVGAEDDLRLIGKLVKSPPDNAGLFIHDDFSVIVKFKQDGPPLDAIDGDIELYAAQYQYEVVNGDRKRELRIGEPIHWRIRAQDVSVGAELAYKTRLRSVDRNGKPIIVELPELRRFRIHAARGMRRYFAFGRVGFEADPIYAADDSSHTEVEPKIELELGMQFRIWNIAQRGIPLYYGFFIGGSFEDTRDLDFEDESTSDSGLILDYRWFAGLGLTASFGTPELNVDLGYMQFNRAIDSNLPGDRRVEHERESKSSFMIRTGLGLNIMPMINWWIGARILPDLEATHYYMHLKFQNAE